MENRKIPIIALAVFSIVILLAQNNIDKAFAITFKKIVIDNPIAIITTTISGIQYFITVDEQDGVWQRIRVSDGIVVNTGTPDTVCETGGVTSCIYQSIACSGSTCYIKASATGAGLLMRLVKIDVVSGSQSVVFSSTLPYGGNILLFGSVIIATYTSGANEILQQINTGDFSVVDSADLNVPTPKALFVSSIGSFAYVAIGGSTILDIFNISTNSITCQFGTVDNFIDATRHASNWYVTSDDGLVRVINNACTLVDTIPATSFGCSGGVSQGIESNGNDIIFVACDVASANNKIVSYNTTLNNDIALATYACGGNSVWNDNQQEVVSYSSANDVIACSMHDLDFNYLIYQQASESGLQQAGQACVDTNLDGITDTCFTDTNGDGVPDSGTAGNWAILRVNQNVTQSGNQFACALGLSQKACTDPDSKTNGVGYWLLLALIIFTLMFVYGGAKYAGYELQSVPLYLVAVLLLVDVGIAFFSGWTDGLIFYTLIFIFVGLGALGIAQKVLSMRSGG